MAVKKLQGLAASSVIAKHPNHTGFLAWAISTTGRPTRMNVNRAFGQSSLASYDCFSP